MTTNAHVRAYGRIETGKKNKSKKKQRLLLFAHNYAKTERKSKRNGLNGANSVCSVKHAKKG